MSFNEEKQNFSATLIVLLAFLLIPFKIMSYGWLPVDDAMRHVPFATQNCKWSSFLVIDEKFDTDHNAGWHQTLRFLHTNLGLSKIALLRFSVIGLFFLLNLCGIISAPNAICWLLAFLAMLLFDPGLLGRILSGRPYIVSCAITLLIFRLWALPGSESEFNTNKKRYFRLIISIVLFAIGTWIHGSWYLFLMIPFSFLLAGKIKEAKYLVSCVIAGTLLGAFMTGNFVSFLLYHFYATINIYSEKTFNWLLVSENASGSQISCFIPFVAAIIGLCIYKKKTTFKELTLDPAFLFMMLSWLLSIMIIRFWVDWGRMSLLFWMSYRFKDLIDSSITLKEPRVKYCLFAFIVCTLVFWCINDGGGRYSKAVFDQPIDFSEERLQGWAPESGGIVYSDSMGVFYKHFFEYPTAPWKYILGFESAIMKDDDKKILRRIGYNFRLPEEFLPWINKMTKADRLITIGSVGDFPQLESIRGARNYWIYRLKTATETTDIASTTASISSTTLNISNNPASPTTE